MSKFEEAIEKIVPRINEDNLLTDPEEQITEDQVIRVAFVPFGVRTYIVFEDGSEESMFHDGQAQCISLDEFRDNLMSGRARPFEASSAFKRMKLRIEAQNREEL